MRHFVVVAVIFTFMSISCLLINSVHAQEWSFTEKELWKLEEIYMQNYKNKNVKELSNFWHENFIGWPEWAKQPLDLNTVLNTLKKSSDTKTISFKIRPQAIIIHGKTAIVHYFIDLKLIDKKQEKSDATYRIIHIWINKKEKWEILGGMSAK